jgi:hypothetical protein
LSQQEKEGIDQVLVTMDGIIQQKSKQKTSKVTKIFSGIFRVRKNLPNILLKSTQFHKTRRFFQLFVAENIADGEQPKKRITRDM